MEIPSSEPTSIRSGDKIQWTKDLSDFPADDGWALTYTLVLQSDATKRLQVNAVANGKAFDVTLTTANTGGLTVGTYFLFGHVSKASDRRQVYAANVEVLPNLAAVTTGDYRTSAKKALDTWTAVWETIRTGQSVSINGRTLTRDNLSEVRKTLDLCRADYAREQAKEQFARTGINPRRIGLRLPRV